MLTFANKYGFNRFSQNNEDGIIEECLKRILINEPKVCVEFGGHDGFFCSNTRNLINNGWQGYMFDINPGHSDVIQKEITPDNVNDLPSCQVLSIDCDGPDFHIWKAYKGKPDIVIIEINSSIPPMTIEVPGDKGASYHAMVILGLSKGYFLLCHTGNLVFVLMKYLPLFPEVDSYSPVGHWEKFFNKSFL